MEIKDIVNLIMNSGVTVLVLSYFIYRDNKFMTQLNTTLTTLVQTVTTLKEMIENKEK